MANQFVTYVVEENIATITINNPPANALSMPVMKELNSALDELSKNNDAKAIIVTGAGTFFVAGADIKGDCKYLIQKRRYGGNDKGTGEIISRFENSIKPTIAAINGVCSAAVWSLQWHATCVLLVNVFASASLR